MIFYAVIPAGHFIKKLTVEHGSAIILSAMAVSGVIGTEASVCELQPASVENRIYKSPADEVVLGRILTRLFFFLSGKTPAMMTGPFSGRISPHALSQYRPDGITERGGIPYKDRKGVVFIRWPDG